MKVSWTETAEAELDAVVTRVAEDTLSGALTMDSRIRDESRRLADFPMSGREGRYDGTRELVIPRYRCVLIYRLQGEVVEVLRLMHGGQEWPKKI
jgi:toxin ParE1/3/4